MTRNVLLVVGAVLLSIGGIGIIVGLVWLTASHVLGTFPPILDANAERLLYLLPALLFVISLMGASFVAGALASPAEKHRSPRHLRHTARFRG
jgi:hypothetical protein